MSIMSIIIIIMSIIIISIIMDTMDVRIGRKPGICVGNELK